MCRTSCYGCISWWCYTWDCSSVEEVSWTNAVTETLAVPVLDASNSININFTPLEPLLAVYISWGQYVIVALPVDW